MPVPVSWMVDDPPLAECSNRVAVRVPDAVGANVSVTVQLEPPVKVSEQVVLACEKSPLLTSAVKPVKGRLPVFCKVTVPLVVAKLAIAGLNVTVDGVAAKMAALPEPPSATEYSVEEASS